MQADRLERGRIAGGKPAARELVEACGGVLSERAISRLLVDRQLLIKGRRDRPTVSYVPKLKLYVKCFALRADEFAPGQDDEDDC